MKKTVTPVHLATFALCCAAALPLQADSNHRHEHHMHDETVQQHAPTGPDNMFLVKRKINGYDVSFHIMKAQPGRETGGSHDFMIKVEKNGQAQTDIVMNTKAIHPDGKSETRRTMKTGDWLMAGYDLGHKGEHQLMILFRTADGKKHSGGIFYPARHP